VMDVEPLIVSGLDRLVPLPSGERADWQDVLQRAGETRRRRLGIPRPGAWSRLQIAIVVIVVGLMLAAVATATYLAIQAAPLSKQLVTGQLVKLRMGTISTHLLGTNVSFDGEYGLGFKADKTQFVVGDHPGGLQQRTHADFAVGVNGIKLPLKQAAKQLEKTPGVRVLSTREKSSTTLAFPTHASTATTPTCTAFSSADRNSMRSSESPHGRSPAVLNRRGRSTQRWRPANDTSTSC
jgi:hypothetical protein